MMINLNKQNKIYYKKLFDKIKNKIVFVYGDIGVGKTRFIQKLINSTQQMDTICSPTFSIMHQYKINQYNIFHIDFFRYKQINFASELISSILEQNDKNYIVIIEWPQIIEKIIKPDIIINITECLFN